ncbi:MAG: divalent metal cation transporter [Verrucomicrobiota bacterium]
MITKLKTILRSVGPAIVVAAVVLGPGSIMTSSKVGATFGFSPLLVLAGAVVLMMGMVTLAMRLGVSYQQSPCQEIANRIGRPAAVILGLIVFTLIALYQASNNIAIIGGLETLFDSDSHRGLWIGILILLNGIVLLCVYRARNVYKLVEKTMKILIGLMVAAFLANFLVVLFSDSASGPRDTSSTPHDLLPLLGMIGTTFSIAGAFYQAYLVKEKNWSLANVKEGTIDSIVSISVLGGISAVILMTSAILFYGRVSPDSISTVQDIANQLAPLFGPRAKYVFCFGLLAGALSSFMVNAMIGGTILADGIGKGRRMTDPWTRHGTAFALTVGLILGSIGVLKGKDSIVAFITLAQALTVLGMPLLAAAMLYLATRKELTKEQKIPTILVAIAAVSLIVACILAVRLGGTVWEKLAA